MIQAKDWQIVTQICNNFLQALEQKKYGWFWECPNGDKVRIQKLRLLIWHAF